MKITFAEAVKRARSMIWLRPEDEGLSLDDAISEVRNILAADDTPAIPELDIAIESVRSLVAIEREEQQARDQLKPTKVGLKPHVDEEEELSDLLMAYLKSQRDLNQLLGTMALGGTAATKRPAELVMEKGQVKERLVYHRPKKIAALTAG